MTSGSHERQKTRWNVLNQYFHAEECAGNWVGEEGTRTFHSPCLVWAWASGIECASLTWVFLQQKMKTSPPWGPLATYQYDHNPTNTGCHRKTYVQAPTLHSMLCAMMLYLFTNLIIFLFRGHSIIYSCTCSHLAPTQGLSLWFVLSICVAITHLSVKWHKSFYTSEFRHNKWIYGQSK